MNWMTTNVNDDLFTDLLSDFTSNFPKQFEVKNFDLVTDIVEKDGVYTISSNLAGFTKDDIKVELNNGTLTISAEKSEKEEEDEGKYALKESYSKVSRSFTIGKEFSEEDLDAEFKEGILTISFTKKEPKESLIKIK